MSLTRLCPGQPRGQPHSDYGLRKGMLNPSHRLSTPSWDGGYTLAGNTFQASVRGQPLACVRGPEGWHLGRAPSSSFPGDLAPSCKQQAQRGTAGVGAHRTVEPYRGPEQPPCLCLCSSCSVPSMPPLSTQRGSHCAAKASYVLNNPETGTIIL